MSATTKRSIRGVIAPLAVRTALAALVDKVGPAEAARQVGIAPQTLPRFLAGMPVLSNGLFAVAARLQVRLAGIIAVEGDVEAEDDTATATAPETVEG